MELQYIFIRKPKSSIVVKDSNKLFKNMFKDVFSVVTFDTFEINIDKNTYIVSFKSSHANEGIVYLTLLFDNSPYLSAKVLSKVDDCLRKGIHRKDFYIINSYDEPSAYYCENLAPRFGKFERLMRTFIYTSLTKSLGIKWFEVSFTKEIKESIKEKGNISDKDLIERGLYEMTFSQLYDYLFIEYSTCSTDTAIYENLLTQDLFAMEKSKIIDIINSCKKESLWNRFFKDANFNLEEPLRNMREYRNKVAHNKFIKYEEYNECKRKLIKINKTLENAIKKLNSDIYTERHLFDSLMSLAALFTGLLKNEYDALSTVQKNFSTLGKTLIKSIEPYASVKKMTTMYNLGSVISDLQKLSSSLTDDTIQPFLYEESQINDDLNS